MVELHDKDVGQLAVAVSSPWLTVSSDTGTLVTQLGGTVFSLQQTLGSVVTFLVTLH